MLTKLLQAGEAVNQGALGKLLGMKPNGITQAVDALEARGLATRESGRADGRTRFLRVTDAGAAHVAAVNEALVESLYEHFPTADPTYRTILEAAVAAAARQLTGAEPMIVGPGMKTGMNIIAETQNQLGSDIVASAVAALHRYPAPIIVIEIGTATTISYLSPNTFEGCVIFPGVRIAVEALSGRAAALPHIALEEPAAPSILGRSTIEAMRAGALYGNAGMLDSIIQRMEEAAKPAATVVMTGAQAELIGRYCRREILYDKDLILDGLYVLYQKNSGLHDRRKKK